MLKLGTFFFHTYVKMFRSIVIDSSALKKINLSISQYAIAGKICFQQLHFLVLVSVIIWMYTLNVLYEYIQLNLVALNQEYCNIINIPYSQQYDTIRTASKFYVDEMKLRV